MSPLLLHGSAGVGKSAAVSRLCAELGVPQRELFLTADLFDGKDLRAVLRNLDGLARFAQEGIPGFHGPFVGKKVAATRKQAGHAGVAAPRVIIGGGIGWTGGGGRGM